MELSIIAGNDFTKQFSQQLKTKLGLPERSWVAEIADWVREHKLVENHPAAAQMMVRVVLSETIYVNLGRITRNNVYYSLLS